MIFPSYTNAAAGSSSNRERNHAFIKAVALAGTVAIFTATSAFAADVKIGFIVKQPEEPWFQDEWKFADEAAKEKGFTLVKIGAQDGEKVQSAIDNLGAQGAQGFIICTPDVKLGPGIVAKAAANDLKLMTVDDRLVNADGSPIEDVPHMGISATKIGEAVGEAIVAEIKKRGWDMKEVGAIRVSYDQLPTAVDRVEGALSVLKANGFPEANIFDAPQAKTDTEAALNAATVVLNKNAGIKKWVAVGLNDEAVLGAVRATETVGIPADSMIGIGIAARTPRSTSSRSLPRRASSAPSSSRRSATATRRPSTCMSGSPTTGTGKADPDRGPACIARQL